MQGIGHFIDPLTLPNPRAQRGGTWLVLSPPIQHPRNQVPPMEGTSINTTASSDIRMSLLRDFEAFLYDLTVILNVKRPDDRVVFVFQGDQDVENVVAMIALQSVLDIGR